MKPTSVSTGCAGTCAWGGASGTGVTPTFDEEELKEFNEMDEVDRPLNFIP